MTTITGPKRHLVRPAKTVESPNEGGKYIANLNSELQAKLKERKDPVEDSASNPKMKRIAGRVKSKSISDKVMTSVVYVTPSSKKTRWHVKPPSRLESENVSANNPTSQQQSPQLNHPVRSVSYLKANIPPPPKNPPPILALKPQTTESSKTSLQKSLSAVPPQNSHQEDKEEVQDPPSTSSAPPSSPDSKLKRESLKMPLSGSKSVGGVKKLMRVFESDQSQEGEVEAENHPKELLFNKTHSEPKDLGSKAVPESPTKAARNVQNDNAALVTREGNVNSLKAHITSSNESLMSNPYQNVFEDEAFARFDKRSQTEKTQGTGSRKDRKPKPLPRKGSFGTFPGSHYSSSSMNSGSNSSLNSLHSPHFSTTRDLAEVSLRETPEVDEVEDHEKMDSGGLSSSKPDVTVFQPLDELENEIDLLADIAKYPPLKEPQTKSTIHKVELSKTQSHNPGGIPITRRTTPKERKELRHGVRSDGAQMDSDEDDYIPMNPILLSQSFLLPSSPADPRASGYYLKVLPSAAPALPSVPQEPPKSPGDVYIDMETPNVGPESQSLPIHLLPEPKADNLQIGKSSRAQTSPKNLRIEKPRALKYSDVTIEKPGRATIKQRSASSPIKYQVVKVGKQPSLAKESSLTESKKSQGALFADRPLPPRPDHESPYYITHVGATPSPLSQSAPTRKAMWHEYVEIDEDDLEKMSGSPPKIPKRPENLDKLSERKNVSSVEYSYAAVPGQNMFGLQWMNFHARIPQEKIPPPELVSKKSTPPRYIEQNEKQPPPPPPPKSESLLREQGLIPAYISNTPQPYLTPIFMKRKMSVPIIPISNSTPLPSLATQEYAAKPIDVAMGREPSPQEDSTRRQRRETGVPYLEKQGNELPRRRVPPPKPDHLKLISHQKSSSGPILGQGVAKDGHGGEKSRRALFDHQQRSFDEGGAVAKHHMKLSRQRSHSAGDMPAMLKRNQLRQSKSYVPESGSGRSSAAETAATETEDMRKKKVITQSQEAAQLLKAAQPQQGPIKRRRKLGVRNKIDRQSLAIIMQNREAIARQLSKAKDSEQIRAETDGVEMSNEKQFLLRNLGEILLEIDALFRHNLCTEEDLITAIEQQLHIKLEPSRERTSSPCEAHSRQSSKDQSDFSKPLKNPSVEITDQDVDDVVSFVNTNGIVSPEQENPPEFHPPMQKLRSDTVIILDDLPSPDNNPHSPASSPTGQDGSVDDSPPIVDNFTRSFDHNIHKRIDMQSLATAGMRVQRSFSAGHKPLRRVNAKRRPSASDIANASCNTAFCNGEGVFTHKGGKLTNLVSGVEIEVPEGAIPKGRKQRLWFDVLQSVYDPREEETLQRSSSSSASSTCEVENHLQDRKNRKVELSPVILVGPCDAALIRPIKIKIPHCLPYRNNSWHLQMMARAQNSTTEDWIELSNSSGLIIPERNKRLKFYKYSTYQMSLEYAMIRTKQLGSFRLCGNPIRHGTHSAKRMVASVYTKSERTDDSTVLLDVFLTNAICDQVQVSSESAVVLWYVVLSMCWMTPKNEYFSQLVNIILHSVSC